MVQQPNSGLRRLVSEVLDHTQLDTHTHTAGVLCTSDQLVAEAAT
jgi:hypothetical protein